MNKEKKNPNKCPICGRPTHKDSKYCIFHAKAEEKTENEFKKALKEYINSIKKENKDHNFERFIFIGDINFKKDTNITIFKNAGFVDAIFGGYADFAGTTFRGVASFEKIIFKGDANFAKVTFEGYSNFWKVHFYRNAGFVDAIFKTGTNFRRAILVGDANFEDVAFEGYADFVGAIFEGDAKFEKATFYGGADFGRTIFNRYTNVEYLKNFYGHLVQPNTVFSTGISSIESMFDEAISIEQLMKPVDNSQITYREKIVNLENQVNDLLKKLQIKSKQKEELKEQKEEIKEKLEILNNDKKILDLSNRICEKGKNKLLKSTKFRNLFAREKCFSVVLAIDIRRSTELMLKAKNPINFANFVSSLCIQMMDIIKTNYGVVDKFTGDGILSFFPDFYSGSDAIYYALNSANQCNNYFKKHYDNSRTLFSTILNEVGLGIGIDYGETSLVEINNVLTVVGIPVVYACRLSNANFGEILLNQSAYEVSIVKHKKCCQYNESELDIKYEGKILTYKLEKYIFPKEIICPEWIKE